MLNLTVVQPTTARVRSACAAFDRANQPVEKALEELFGLYTKNDNLPHILLKVVVLNGLYSTHILDLQGAARLIYGKGDAIDHALASGLPEIVDEIAWLTNSTTGKRRRNYSFATKYCSWHNPVCYPIWDRRVDEYLWALNKAHGFTQYLAVRDDLLNYANFCQIMCDFRQHYDLGEFTFKEIDKFIWSQADMPDLARLASA